MISIFFYNIKINNRISLSLLLLIIATLAFSQVESYLPTVVPPSPQAQAFMRYGEIPVNYSTGVPNISIPIYTLKGRQLEVPISISYHASGIKVNDIASEVGLGWVLNAGGLVARTIMGIRDEMGASEKTYSYASEIMDTVYAASIEPYDIETSCYKSMRDLEYWFSEDNEFENEDPESDRFFYSLPNGVSGVFRTDYLNSDSIITLPYRPLKIKKYYGTLSSRPVIDSIRIIDIDGKGYIFRRYKNNQVDYINEWYLSKIISADGTDSITFEYLQIVPLHSMSVKQDIIVEERYSISGQVGTPEEKYDRQTTRQELRLYDKPVLLSIVSSTAVVKFNYATDREDFDELKRLTSITISPVDSPSNIIKSIQFTPEYFGSTVEKKRLGLDNIIISAPGDPQPQTYSFNYESRELPPYSFKMESERYNSDFWGYNNESNSHSLIQSDFITNQSARSLYGGDRTSHYYSSTAAACMLNEIIYPTGGRSVFEFDRLYSTNVYDYEESSNARSGYLGGFRVESIKTYDKNDSVVGMKTYEYSNQVYKQVKERIFSYTQDINALINEENQKLDWTIKRIHPEPMLPLEVAPGLQVVYRTVIVYNGTKEDNTGKTVYSYSDPYSPFDWEIHDHDERFEDDYYFHSFNYDRGNYLPELKSITEYSFDGKNYYPVSKTINTYDTLFTKEFQTGIKLTRLKTYEAPYYFCFSPEWFEIDSTLWPINFGGIGQDFFTSFAVVDTKAFQEASLLTNTKKYTYVDPLDPDNYILTTTDYTYNEKNVRIKEKMTISSKGDTLMTKYKYPFDFNEDPYYSMVDRNIITPVIEQIGTNNSSHIKSVKTNYSFWEADEGTIDQVSGFIEVDAAISTTSSSSFSITASMQLSVNLVLSMFHGHFRLSISGPTTFDELYYGDCDDFCTKNFHEDINLSPGSYTISILFIPGDGYPDEGYYGSATYSGSSSGFGSDVHPTLLSTERIYPSSVDVKIGENDYINRLNYHTYDTCGNIISVSKTDDLIISYLWAYNRSLPVIKAENCTYDELELALNNAISSGKAKVYDNIYNNLDDFLTEVSSLDHEYKLTGWADFVSYMQEQLPDARVSLYTYLPLIGKTSETTPDGRTTYYKYDNFGRLFKVIDQNGNLREKYDYNYAK